ncbi:MAG: hypothetical protein MZV65_41410 [Chromatiales bacterium]|nr:hypothetical protein [Chromatiales bacterium]
MSDNTQNTQQKSGAVQTTGHAWDGDLQEYNNPLPRWWLWCFYGTVVFSILVLVHLSVLAGGADLAQGIRHGRLHGYRQSDRQGAGAGVSLEYPCPAAGRPRRRGQ